MSIITKTQTNSLPAQDFEPSSLIDTKLPTEMLANILSILSPKDLVSTTYVTKYWQIASFDAAKRREISRLSSYSDFLIKNLTAKFQRKKPHIEKLISATIKKTDKCINLLQIKDTLLTSKDSLIGILKKLTYTKQKELQAKSEGELKPFLFHDIFSFVNFNDRAIQAANDHFNRMVRAMNGMPNEDRPHRPLRAALNQ